MPISAKVAVVMLVVFGSINVDLVFPAPALPRPGETVLTPAMQQVPGGKGANQALAAARAGAEVEMFGCVGRDAFADLALSGLRGAGVALDGVAPVGAGTGCAAVVVGPDGENQIVVASGANLNARADQVPDKPLGPATTLLLQQEVSMAENHRLATRARAAGARIVLNAAPAAAPDPDMLRAVDVLIVNEIEAEMTAAALGVAKEDLAGALGRTVVLTLGGAGAYAIDADGQWSIGTLDIVPVDTTGAGDAFCGYLAALLDGGEDMPAALRWASVAAGMACLTEGAQNGVPSRREVAARLDDLAPARRET